MSDLTAVFLSSLPAAPGRSVDQGSRTQTKSMLTTPAVSDSEWQKSTYCAFKDDIKKIAHFVKMTSLFHMAPRGEAYCICSS